MKRDAHSHSHCRCGAHDHETATLPKLTAQLRRKSRRITGPRQAILEIMRRHPHPMAIKEIFAELPKGDCDLATVYRSMHLLEGMKMVKRFDLGDGAARFELLAEGDDGHHHHLVCVRCSTVIEINECFTRELERKVAAQNGFKAITHKLEFFGICPECQ